MKPLPRLARLALAWLASSVSGCGGHDRQVVYPSRRGPDLRVDPEVRAATRPAPIDLKAPTRAPDQAGTVDVPMFDIESPSPR